MLGLLTILASFLSPSIGVAQEKKQYPKANAQQAINQHKSVRT
jgi:hypothetical protein